jgi:hypothetical protein
MRPTAILCRLAVLLLAVLVAGCGKGNKNVTKDNLGKIKPGMSYHEVVGLLGDGEEVGDPLALAEGSSVAGAGGIGGDLNEMSRRKSSTRWFQWGDDNKHIRVGFDNDKVTADKIHSKGL